VTTSIVIGEPELQWLTGYKLPSCQLRELKKQGFFRARLNPVTGRVVLERAHYDAVCGGSRLASTSANEPQLKSQRSRRAA
jgi:hypothetical protein